MLGLERFLHRHIGSEVQKEAPGWLEEKLGLLVKGGGGADGKQKADAGKDR